MNVSKQGTETGGVQVLSGEAVCAPLASPPSSPRLLAQVFGDGWAFHTDLFFIIICLVQERQNPIWKKRAKQNPSIGRWDPRAKAKSLNQDLPEEQ